MATLLAAVVAGVDAVDVASARMAGRPQPPARRWSPRREYRERDHLTFVR
jgi:pyruvate carboxylase